MSIEDLSEEQKSLLNKIEIVEIELAKFQDELNIARNIISKEHERINSYGNWWESRGIKGTSDFGSYTGEQVLAFLQEPIIKRLVNNELGYESSIPVKQLLYNQNSWHQAKRWKYTGWERFERTDLFNSLNVRSMMNELKQQYNGSYYLDYDETVKQLRGIE